MALFGQVILEGNNFGVPCTTYKKFKNCWPEKRDKRLKTGKKQNTTNEVVLWNFFFFAYHHLKLITLKVSQLFKTAFINIITPAKFKKKD